ncbi:NAD(+) diphosphatase [Sneathiella sp. CAU 1612]|uniref:NAD(+) diphosphatase n=1 Tax=Sneathiella sedimenti TaxID=2816034 RepID=A0ABS3F1G5_9PROT|nr:NAD(+) diphosphatase [Sneathiella sedimenti]MBO0332355.1 NAD(+) diphosphatase [Sneathiella sedimenti]
MKKPIVFAGGDFDRASHLRTDPNWIEQKLRDPNSRFLPMHQLKALISLTEGARIDWRGYSEVQEFITAGASLIFLGNTDTTSHFAIDVSEIENPKRPPVEDWGKFIDVRSVAPQLSSGEAGALAQARSMIDWHNRHGFCAVCGAPTQPQEAGYSRKCEDTSCSATHFPRTDPVAIMMVTKGDKCLLGQGINFPGDFYSCLAGFIEPGETIEQGVMREVLEESGIQVTNVRYHQSQPWPFPSSLMIGCFADALNDDITVDHTELNDARWFTREEVRRMLEQSTKPTGLRIGGPIALAHQLAKAWVEEAAPVA